MENMTKLLEKNIEELAEQRHILLAFLNLVGHFNAFFEGKTHYLPKGMIPFLENLTIFLQKVKPVTDENLVLKDDILEADKKPVIMLRDIALFVKRIEKFTKTIEKLNNETEVFANEGELLINTHLAMKKQAERRQN